MGVAGGKAQGVYVVSDAEISSGAFRVAPGPAYKVVGMAAGERGVESGPLTPVYVVSDTASRGVVGGNAVPVSNLTGVRPPVHDLAIPIYVVEDDGQFAAPIEPPTDFWNFLFAFYQMEEASGTRVDEISGRNLSVVGTDAGNAAGKFGNAKLTVGSNGGYLRSTDSGWNNWASFSGTCWFYPIAVTGISTGLMCSYLSGTSGDQRSWILRLFGGKLGMIGYWGSISSTEPFSASDFVTGAWNFAAFRYNHITRDLGVRWGSDAWTSLQLPSAMWVGAYPFIVSTRRNAVETNGMFNGRIDHVAIWRDYILTDADTDFLYNGGTGRTWTEIQEYGNAP